MYGEKGLVLLNSFLASGGTLEMRNIWFDEYRVGINSITIDTDNEGLAAESLATALIKSIGAMSVEEKVRVGMALGLEGSQLNGATASLIAAKAGEILDHARLAGSLLNSGFALASGLDHLARGQYTSAVVELLGPAVKTMRVLTKSGSVAAMPIGPATGRLNAILPDYWQVSSGIARAEAETIAKAEGFGLRIGRNSRYDVGARSVVIGKADTQKGLVNRILLAEEIQHGLDHSMGLSQAAAKAGTSVEKYHSQVFQRIIEAHKGGRFKFLTADDIKALEGLSKELGK